VRLHESNVILVNFHTWPQSTGFVVVLVLVLDKIMIIEDENDDENEDEKYQIRSPESATYMKLQFLLRSDWTLAARGGARVRLDCFRRDNRINRIFLA